MEIVATDIKGFLEWCLNLEFQVGRLLVKRLAFLISAFC